MKVMFVVERMEVGGAQRQIAYMANHLSRRNIEVSLLVMKKRVNLCFIDFLRLPRHHQLLEHAP